MIVVSLLLDLRLINPRLGYEVSEKATSTINLRVDGKLIQAEIAFDSLALVSDAYGTSTWSIT